jgi:alpha-galactosidase
MEIRYQDQGKRLAQMTRLADDPKASLTEELGAETTREQQVPIIDDLVNNKEGYFQVNVPNRGALSGIPDDVVVEVPAIVNKKGIQPIRVEPLPAKIMVEQILPEWLDMERELLALESGDRAMLLWNVLQSPQTRSLQQAVQVFDELMAMPGHEEINERFDYAADATLLREQSKETSPSTLPAQGLVWRKQRYFLLGLTRRTTRVSIRFG